MTTLSPTPVDLDELQVEDLIHRPGVYVVTLTPADATRLLERNVANRRPKDRAIEEYARAMRTGQWHRTNQGIGFNTRGELVDGQNRLIACQRADVPFTTLVATGLEVEARDVVDVGVKRTIGDAMRMEGISSATMVAAGVVARYGYETLAKSGRPYTARGGHSTRLTHIEALAYLQAHPSLADRTTPAWQLRKTFPKVPTSALLAMESLGVDADPDGWAEFRNALITGAMLDEGDPRLALRNYLNRAVINKPTTLQVLAAMVKSWNAWRAGEKRDLITVKATEPLPPFYMGKPAERSKVKVVKGDKR